jgi:hypothetical protein
MTKNFDKFCNSILLEKVDDILPKSIDEFSEEEKQNTLNKLSDVERAQLGTPRGGTSARNYTSADDWIIVRDYLLRSALKRNPGTDPEFCAYTPGETLTLIHNPIVQNWFKKVENFVIPSDKEKVVFVSCAANKRWGKTTRAKEYKCYNMLRNENDKIYWVTISEPLGIIPEDYWDTFPLYDNPGLFKELGKAGIETRIWKSLFGKDSSFYYPCDEGIKKECINILGNVIKKFYDFNKQINPNLEFISAVESASEKSTHSQMLDVSGILDKEKRFFKKQDKKENPNNRTNDSIEKHFRDIINR